MKNLKIALLMALTTSCATTNCNPPANCASAPAASSTAPCLVAPVVNGTAVCGHLADIGCTDGIGAKCAQAFDAVQGGGISDLKPACLMAAATVEQALACGTVICK